MRRAPRSKSSEGSSISSSNSSRRKTTSTILLTLIGPLFLLAGGMYLWSSGTLKSNLSGSSLSPSALDAATSQSALPLDADPITIMIHSFSQFAKANLGLDVHSWLGFPSSPSTATSDSDGAVEQLNQHSEALPRAEISNANTAQRSKSASSSNSGKSAFDNNLLASGDILYSGQDAKESFIPFLLETIRQGDDLVFLSRFWYEKQISYAKDTDKDGNIDRLSDPSYRPWLWLPFNVSVPVSAWARTETNDNYFHKKAGRPETYAQMANVMKRVLEGESSKKRKKGEVPGSIKAIRFHMYMQHCYFVNKLNRGADQLPVPVILTTRLDENTGFFSSDVWPKTCSRTGSYDHAGNRCTEAYHMNETLKLCDGRSYSDYQRALDQPNILLLLASQHHAFPHPKILSLPLGVRKTSGNIIISVLEELRLLILEDELAADSKSGKPRRFVKKKLVTINNSGWWYRAKVNKHFEEAFGTENSYSIKNRQVKKVDPAVDKMNGEQKQRHYYTELALSKFVICPPGIGYDTYRMWEVLAVGSIPVVESSPGLDKSFSLLPVLVVRDLTRVTPEFLQASYGCFVRNANNWRFDWLMQHYWDNLIVTALGTGSIEHITKNHPDKNPYCWFYDESP